MKPAARLTPGQITGLVAGAYVLVGILLGMLLLGLASFLSPTSSLSATVIGAGYSNGAAVEYQSPGRVDVGFFVVLVDSDGDEHRVEIGDRPDADPVGATGTVEVAAWTGSVRSVDAGPADWRRGFPVGLPIGLAFVCFASVFLWAVAPGQGISPSQRARLGVVALTTAMAAALIVLAIGLLR